MSGGARVFKAERKVSKKVAGGVGGHFARGVRRFWGWNCRFTSCSGAWVSETVVIRPLMGPKSRTPHAKPPLSDPTHQKARFQTQTPDPRPQIRAPDPRPQIPDPVTNPGSQTSGPRSHISDPDPRAQNPKPHTPKPGGGGVGVNPFS